jgi:hypothetical protein
MSDHTEDVITCWKSMQHTFFNYAHAPTQDRADKAHAKLIKLMEQQLDWLKEHPKYVRFPTSSDDAVRLKLSDEIDALNHERNKLTREIEHRYEELDRL